jgi:hypothetical protein
MRDHVKGISLMRIRTGLCLLAGCCAALTACTAAPHKGPVSTVTKPAINKPPAPASEAAALDSEPLTPYFDLGAAANDGLAPGDTYAALHTACMNDAGYSQYANSTPFPVRANRGMGFPQPFGPWGYIGAALAQQYGFNAPESDGPDENDASLGSPATMPAAAQSAVNKCFNIVQAFNNAQFAGSTAGIETMNNEVSDDVVQDSDLTRAAQAWSACMARNGYDAVQPNTIWQQQLTAAGLGPTTPQSAPVQPSAATNRAQIAAAVTDANCTLSTDLGGIYFAIQDSYEQQFITANQQALNTAVREFKANFAKELSKLPQLLRTTSATLNVTGPGGKHGKPGHLGKTARPSPSHP